ncbi:MAG: glycosyl hydrolase family 28-related protein [Rhodospirillales bacterium]
MTPIGRRDLFAGGAGFALAASTQAAAAAPARADIVPDTSARAFGAIGDGVTDDSAALQKLFDAVFAGKQAKTATIPPGRYLVKRPIRVKTAGRSAGNITRRCGILAHGAVVVSAIKDGSPVIEIESRATLRYVLIDGLQIQGSGHDGHGLSIICETRGTYFYNFCLRDIVVEGCGGDGCRLIGNIFEGQIFNSYFRDNKGNGATFGHGRQDTVLSAVHVFGGVFGGNGRDGAALIQKAADVGFYGCYFLLNQRYGLSASTGCTLLSHCGFENNHQGAPDFARGGEGLRLLVGGTLIGCTAYSIYNQTGLIRAFVTNRLTMIGCTGDGGGKAKKAGLGEIHGKKKGNATLIGCHGSIKRKGALDVVDMASSGGLRLGGGVE